MHPAKKSRRQDKSVQSGSARANPVAIAASVAVGALIGEGARAHNIQVAHIAAGSAKINESGLRTTVVASNRTIIDYTRFDVSQFETVQFVLPNVHSSILNRIDSSDPSHIDGHVIGNGSIYFVNPAGVLFGPHAVLNVNNLYAAAGNISDKDFLAGNNHFTVGQGSVVNEGTLKADTVALVGRQVINRGVIVGQSVVTMASGDDVYLGQRDGNVMVQVNSASTPASAANQEPDLPLGAGDIYSLAITNTGQVKGPGINVQAGAGTASISGKLDASNAAGKGGSINITAPQVVVDHATINASGSTGGGTILVGGDAHGQGALPNAQQTSVSTGSTITADATKQGDGGKVVVWSDQSTQVHGSISARGGATSGNGGFVETSGHLLDVSGASVDTSAPGGKKGSWLLDPGDVTIESAADISSSDPQITGNPNPPAPPLTTYDSAGGSFVSFETINGAVNTTDVTVSATGTIQVNAPSGGGPGILRTASSAATLKLSAVGSVTVSGQIKSTTGPLDVDIETSDPSAHVNINAPVITDGGAFTSHASGAGSDFKLNNDGTTTHGSIDTTGSTTGAVTINHTGAVNIGGTINAGGKLDVTSSATTGTTISADITTAGGQDFHNPVTIAGTPTLKDTTTGAITFEDTLDGQNPLLGPSGLTINTQGLTTFSKDVGGLQPLTSLSVSNGAAKSLGSKIVTSGNGQSYAGDLTITAAGPFNLSDTGTTSTSTLNFKSTITAGTADLQASSGGLTTFAGNVTANSLTTAATGSTALNASVSTTNGQTYQNPVTVQNPTASPTTPITLTDTSTTAGILFKGTVSGVNGSGSDLVVTTPAATEFDGAVGGPTSGLSPLTSIAITNGPTKIDGGSVYTIQNGTATGTQSYSSAGVTISKNTTLSGTSIGAVTIDGTPLNGLTLDFSTPVLLDGSTGSINPTNIGTLEVKQGATLGGTMSPTGPVIFDGLVTLNSDTTVTSGAFPVTFTGGVSAGTSNFSFNVSTTGTVKLGGAVSVGSLIVAGGQIDLVDGATSANPPAITTIHSQKWTGPIELFDNTSLISTNAATADTLTFTTINGNDGTSDHALSLQFGGDLPLSDANVSGISTLTVGTLGSTFGRTQLAASLTTSGPQNFFDPVQLTSSVVLKSKNNPVTFGNTIDGPGGLEVDTTATTYLGRSASLDGQIGGKSPLASLDIPDGPTHVDNLSQISTTGTQSYLNAFSIGTYQWSSISINSGGAVTFGTSGSGLALEGSTTNLSISAPNILFYGPVHLSALTAAITDPAGSTQIYGSEVRTRHKQTYTTVGPLDPVQILGPITHEGTTLQGDSITFKRIQANNHQLNVSSATPIDPATMFDGLGGLHELSYPPNGFSFSGSDSDLPPDHLTKPLLHPVGTSTDPTSAATIFPEFDIGTSLSATGTLEFDDEARLTKDGLTLTATNAKFHGGLIGGGTVGVDPTTPIYKLTIDADGIQLDKAAKLGELIVSSDVASTVTLSSVSTVHIETFNSGIYTGNQTYLKPLILDSDTLLRGNGPATVLTYPLSADAIDGSAANHNLTLQFTGPTLIDGNFIQNIGNLIVGPISAADDFTTTITTKALLKNTITTSGLQLYSEPVVLQGNTIVRNDPASSTPAHASASPITFGDTVDGSFALTADTAALTTFDKAVGSGSPLVRLSVITGPAEIDAPSVKTAVDVPNTSALIFAGDLTLYGSNTTVNPTSNVSLPAPVLFTDGNGGTITFSGKLNGAQSAGQAWNSNLTIDTTALTTFSKAVNLGSLDVATGNSEIDGASVSTAGTGATALGQYYHGAVTLNGGLVPTNNTTVLSDNNAGTITFHTTLSGSLAAGQNVDTSLSISSTGSSGLVTFGGAVDVGTLSVTSRNIEIDGGSVATNRFAGGSSKAATIGQVYRGDVTLNGPHHADSTITDAPASLPVSFTDGQAADVIFAGKLNGTVASGAAFASMVNVSSNNATTAGQVAFGGAVNLGSLKVLNGTSTEIDGGQIATLGLGNGSLPLIGALPVVGQYYSAPVTLNSGQVTLSAGSFSLPALGSAVSFSDSAGGGITFHSTLTGPSNSSDVQISTTLSGGQITFGGAVSVGSLKVTAGQTEVDGGGVTTSSSAIGQYYSGSVTLNGPHAGDASIVDQLTSILTPPAMGIVKFTDNSAGGITFNDSLTGTIALQLGYANVTLSSRNGSSVGQVTLRGVVDVGSLVVSNGNTEIDGGVVSTHATLSAGNGFATGSDNLGQYYNGSVTLNAQSPAGSTSLLNATTLKDTPFTAGMVGDVVLPQGATDFASTPSAPIGTQHTDLVVQTPGLSVFASSSSLGSLKVVAGPAEIDGATIDTAGTGSPVPSSTVAVGQYYLGNVGINTDAYSLLSSSVTSHPVSLADNNAGAVTFIGQIAGKSADSDLSIDTKNAAKVEGLVTFGNTVQLQSLHVLNGNTEIDGGSITTDKGTGQYFHGIVSLNGGSYGLASNNSVLLSDTSSGNITFHTTLDGATSTGQARNSDLVLDTQGLSTFGGAVTLGSMKVITGPSEIDGGSVMTFGTGSNTDATPTIGTLPPMGQYYHGNVAINGNRSSDPTITPGSSEVQLQDENGGTITFAGRLDGATTGAPANQPINSNLTIDSTGLATLGGAVNIGSLNVKTGPAEIDGGSVTTYGTGSPIAGSSLAVGQYYHGLVTINGAHLSDPGISDLNPPPVTLTDKGAGAITFHDALHGSTNPAHPQPINSDVAISTNQGGTLGQVTFGGAVDVGSLDVVSGHTEIDGGSVTTYGTGPAHLGQYYRDDVVINGAHAADPTISDLNPPPVALSDQGAGSITFHNVLFGSTTAPQPEPITSDLAITTKQAAALGQVTFGGAVNLGSLQVLAGHTEIDGGSVTTHGTGPANGAGHTGQYYANDVVINGPHTIDPTISDHNSPPVALSDDAAGTITFHDVLYGSTAHGQPINSDLVLSTSNSGTLGQITFGGAVDLGSLKVMAGKTEIDGGSVTTHGTGSPITGSSLAVGQYYHNGVVLNGNHLADPTITLGGGNVSLSDDGSGAITFVAMLNGSKLNNGSTAQPLDSNLAIGTKGLTTFGGSVSLGSLDVVTGPAEIDGNTITTFGTGPANLGQSYANTVTLNGSHPSDPGIAITSPNVTLLDNGGGTISFLGQLTGSSSNLTVTTSGKTSFENTVTLNSLQTDGGGVTAIDGGNVTTGSYQWYFDAVTLGAPNTLLKAGSDVFFYSTVDGASNLSVQSPGKTWFDGIVGGKVKLTSLTTDAPGSTAIDGGSITTTGAQFFGDPVTMGASKTSLTAAGGPITFGQTLDGDSNLTLTSNALATFGGKVGAKLPLSSLTVNAQAEIDGGVVDTVTNPTGGITGAQVYNKAVAINGPHANGPAIHDVNPVSFGAGGPITFVSTLNGPAGSSDLLLTSPALTTFGGTVNIGSIEVLKGPSEIDGGSVTTHGTGSLAGSSLAVGQYYRGDVTIDGTQTNAALTDSTGAITFAGSLDGSIASGQSRNTNLTVHTTGLTTFDGAVTLGSLNVDTGPVEIDGGAITTAGSGTVNGVGQVGQYYGNVATLNGNHAADPNITLSANVTLSDSNGGSITFNRTLSGAQASGQQTDSHLTVDTGSLAHFMQAVTLGSLNVSNANGTTSIDGGQVTTSGSQTFNNLVTINASTTFASTGAKNIAFEQSLLQGSNSSYTLTVNTSGQTEFHGDVTVASLTVAPLLTTTPPSAPGSTLIQSDGLNLVGGQSTIETKTGGMIFDSSVSVLGKVTIKTNGGDIVFGSDKAPTFPDDPITPGPSSNATTLATTFVGAAVSVNTNGGSLSFAGPVTFDTAGQLVLSTSNNSPTVQPMTFGATNIPASQTGTLSLQLAETGLPTNMAATFSSGTSNGTIQFVGPVHANSGSVIVQSDHGNILFDQPVDNGGAAGSNLLVGTAGNNPLPVGTTAVASMGDGNVFFKGPVTVNSLQVSGRNILVSDITATQTITLQPDNHLSEVHTETSKTGVGPYVVTDTTTTSLNPTPAVDGLLMIVPQQNQSNVSVVSASGDVNLAPALRQFTPPPQQPMQPLGKVSASVATIVDRAYGTQDESSHNVSISGADVNMGQNEKLTALGDITITATKDVKSVAPDGYSGTSDAGTFEGGVVRLSGLSAFDTIKVKADTAIVLQDRQLQESSAGSAGAGSAPDFFVNNKDKLGDPDNNLNFFARNEIDFEGKLKALKPLNSGKKAPKDGSLPPANYQDVRFGVDLSGVVEINGSFEAPFIQQHSIHIHTKEEFLLPTGTEPSIPQANVILASSASGPSSTTVTAGDITVLAAELPDVQQGDEQLSKAAKETLQKLGVGVKDPLEAAEMVSRVSSHLDYMEGLGKSGKDEMIIPDSIAQVAAQRMDKKVTGNVAKIYDKIYGGVTPDAARKQLLDACEDYLQDRKEAANGFDLQKDAVPFRMLVESGSFNGLRRAIDQMRSMNTQLPLIGLTPAQVDLCRDNLVRDLMRFTSSDDQGKVSKFTKAVTADDLKQVIFFTATWAKPFPDIDPLPPAYLLNGTIEQGGIRLKATN